MSASIQGIYVALFGRPADPAGLAYFNEATDNGANLDAIGDLAKTDEYQNRFVGMTNEQIINSIYQSLFERDGEKAGIDFYVGELAAGRLTINNIAIAILDGAKNDDLATVNAKIAAADIFTSHLDLNAEIEAYRGNTAAQIGRDYLDNITKDNPGTSQGVDDAILKLLPDQGQQPGGGGVGGGSNGPIAEIDANGIVHLAHSATYQDNGDGTVQLSASGYDSLRVDKAVLAGFYLAEGGKLTISGAAFDDMPLTVEGNGILNVTGVTLTDAKHAVDGKAAIDGINVSNLKFVIDTEFRDLDAGNIPNQEVPHVYLNNNSIDGIKLAWIYQDITYVDDRDDGIPNGRLSTNLLGIEIAKQYAQLLEDNPDNGIFDFIAKFGGNREQTLHDNLLGNGAEAAISGSRYGAGASINDPDAQAVTPEQVATLKEQQPADDRPYYDGNKVDSIHAYEAVRAWDFQKGYERPDYITYVHNGTVDSAAINSSTGDLYFGTGGNSPDGFQIARHEGRGVEIGLQIIERNHGDTYQHVTEPDGHGNNIEVYKVDPGHGTSNWLPAKWNFNFSIVTGDNGVTDPAQINLEDYKFKISIDTNPGEDATFKEFTLTKVDADTYVWLSDDGTIFFGGDEFVSSKVEQNSVNIGFDQFDSLFNAYTSSSGFGAGVFDIKLEAFTLDSDVAFIGTAVRAEVEDLG